MERGCCLSPPASSPGKVAGTSTEQEEETEGAAGLSRADSGKALEWLRALRACWPLLPLLIFNTSSTNGAHLGCARDTPHRHKRHNN